MQIKRHFCKKNKRKGQAIAFFFIVFYTKLKFASAQNLGSEMQPTEGAVKPVHHTEIQKLQEKKDAKETSGLERNATDDHAQKKIYTLQDCLDLARKNHPNLWASRARLAMVHAQLDEAKWTPFFQHNAQITAGVISQIGGTPFFSSSTFSKLNTNFTDGLQPFMQVSLNAILPLYTFGKIESTRRAAEAGVRVSEWELEKNKQQVHADTRRAYYTLMLARDAKYVIGEVLEKLNKAIEDSQKKVEQGDPKADEVDALKLESYKDEILVRQAEAEKGEVFAIAALKFMTGVQVGFDIPDLPLERPTNELRPAVDYLMAARLYRPDVNMARAGIEARKAWLDYQRAKLFPDIGLAMSVSYAIAPSAVQQTVAWFADPLNRFGYGAVIGMRWSLDLLPQQARIEQAEAQLEEVKAQQRLALGGVAVEVEGQYGVTVEAQKKEQTWDEAEHRAKRWISLVQDGIELGARDEKQLVEPLRAYVTARANHLAALMELHVAMSELARVTGWEKAAPVMGVQTQLKILK